MHRRVYVGRREAQRLQDIVLRELNAQAATALAAGVYDAWLQQAKNTAVIEACRRMPPVDEINE